MMASNPYTTGIVDWIGENPGMYLKTDPAGAWTSLLCCFRIMWSPHGTGHALVLLEDPAGMNADARSEYSEHVSGAGLDVVLTWGQLGTPYAVTAAVTGIILAGEDPSPAVRRERVWAELREYQDRLARQVHAAVP